MTKILVNWPHVNQRITQRVLPQHRARVQKILNELSVMQAPPTAVGHHKWHIDVYDDRNQVVTRIIARGITIRSVYSPDMPPPSGSSKYSLSALKKAGIPKTPQKEISLLQEVFQEAETGWSGTNGEFFNEYEQELETTIEPIPPTLRSPGVPPPPPSTRREGRGQPPLPPADTEPPAGRMLLPRRSQSNGSASAMLISRSGPGPSIRREYETPWIEEIFTEAEEEMSGENFISENYDVREYNIDEREFKKKNRPKPDEKIRPKDERDANRSSGNAAKLRSVFNKYIHNILKSQGKDVPRKKILEKIWEQFSLEARQHPEGHFHRNEAEARQLLQNLAIEYSLRKV